MAHVDANIYSHDSQEKSVGKSDYAERFYLYESHPLTDSEKETANEVFGEELLNYLDQEKLKLQVFNNSSDIPNKFANIEPYVNIPTRAGLIIPRYTRTDFGVVMEDHLVVLNGWKPVKKDENLKPVARIDMIFVKDYFTPIKSIFVYYIMTKPNEMTVNGLFTKQNIFLRKMRDVIVKIKPETNIEIHSTNKRRRRVWLRALSDRPNVRFL